MFSKSMPRMKSVREVLSLPSTLATSPSDSSGSLKEILGSNTSKGISGSNVSSHKYCGKT